MKILVAARFQFPWEDGVLIYNEMVRQDIEVDIVDADNTSEIIKKLSLYHYDWLFITGSRTQSADFFRYVSEINKVFLWDNDSIDYQDRRKIWEQLVSFPQIIVLTTLYTANELIKMGGNAHWFPHFYDEHYYSSQNERLDLSKPIYDVCFIGNAYGSQKRIDWCNILQSKYKVIFRGNIPGICNNSVFAKDMVDLYKQSKIAIDIKREQGFYGTIETSDRFFRAIGSGVFYLTYEIPGMKEFLDNQDCCDFYPDTIESLCEKIDFYLENEKERERIALSGQQYILQNHSLKIRVKQYLELMKNYDNSIV